MDYPSLSPDPPLDLVRSDLEVAILELEETHTPARSPTSQVIRLPLDAVATAEAFNVRGCELDEQHLGDLVRSLSTLPDLPPILVLPSGNHVVVVDGHHRREAYVIAGRSDVPVQYFAGTVREAVLKATSMSTAATLQMNSQQRGDCAWRLVGAEGFTLPQIEAASGISRSQVGVMRKVRKALGEEAAEYSEWWRARRAAAGRIEPLTNDEMDAWLEAKMQNYADRLRKEFRHKLVTNPEIAAGAFRIHFGRKLPDLVLFLVGHLSDDEREKMLIELSCADAF